VQPADYQGRGLGWFKNSWGAIDLLDFSSSLENQLAKVDFFSGRFSGPPKREPLFFFVECFLLFDDPFQGDASVCFVLLKKFLVPVVNLAHVDGWEGRRRAV